jgi:solute carrier family 35 protein F1/2
MLLDCFTIPCVMVLSRIILKQSYHWKQLGSVGICLAGLCVLVFSDYFYNPPNSGEHIIVKNDIF